MVLGIDGSQIQVDLWQSFFAQAKSTGMKVGDEVKITRAEIVQIQEEKIKYNKGSCGYKIKLVKKSGMEKTTEKGTIEYTKMADLNKEKDEYRMINIKGKVLSATDLEAFKDGTIRK